MIVMHKWHAYPESRSQLKYSMPGSMIIIMVFLTIAKEMMSGVKGDIQRSHVAGRW
jgi:hypothetical protein